MVEQAVAVADFRCQEKMGLMSRMRDYYSRTAGAWVISNADRLRAWKANADASLVRANAIVNK